MNLGIVLLAAGMSGRFGSNKLLADFGGRALICCALEAMQAVPAKWRCVVTGCQEIAALARVYGCDVIANETPELGQAHSIRLGVQAMLEADAALLMVGDQPLITGESLCRLVRAYEQSGKGMACLSDGSHIGNPAVFSSAYYLELLALSGDRGAKGILKAHPEDLLVIPCVYNHELCDADTPQALTGLRRYLEN